MKQIDNQNGVDCKSICIWLKISIRLSAINLNLIANPYEYDCKSIWNRVKVNISPIANQNEVNYCMKLIENQYKPDFKSILELLQIRWLIVNSTYCRVWIWFHVNTVPRADSFLYLFANQLSCPRHGCFWLKLTAFM
jgi:hypothetical protein